MQTPLCLDCVACLDHLEFTLDNNILKISKALKTSKASAAHIENHCTPCLNVQLGESPVHEVLRAIGTDAFPDRSNGM